MIQFHIVSGRQAGGEIVVRSFPFVIGRGQAHLPLDDAGVWDGHVQIDFQRGSGFTFHAHPEALTVVNGERQESGLLRNGDWLELGSARLRVWLTRTEQQTLRMREALTWVALVVLFALQITLMFALHH